MGTEQVKTAINERNLRTPSQRMPKAAHWAFTLLPVLLCASLSAQISLRTVVEMAQQNSSAVKLAEADV